MDVSGSMLGEKIKALKEGLKEFVTWRLKLNANYEELTLITFNDTAFEIF